MITMTSTMPIPNESLVLSIASRPSVAPTSELDSSWSGAGSEPVRSTLTSSSRSFSSLARVAAAHRDRGAALGDRHLDDRRALDGVVEDRRELLADDLRRQLAEHPLAVAVEVEVDDRPVGLRVVAAVGSRDRRTGQLDRAVEEVRPPVRALVLVVRPRVELLVQDLAGVGDHELRVLLGEVREVALDDVAALDPGAVDRRLVQLLGLADAADLDRLVAGGPSRGCGPGGTRRARSCRRSRAATARPRSGGSSPSARRCRAWRPDRSDRCPCPRCRPGGPPRS